MSRPIRIRGGRVLDPARGIDRVQDLWLDQGRVAGLGEDAPAALRNRPDVEVIDAAKAAGLVDNKVVSFSATHTALRLVIPVARRLK